MAQSRLSFLPSALSVRARVAALAIIPIVGFAVIGATYLSGERAIEAAFVDSRASAQLAETSSAFKSALATMREAAKDYSATPLWTQQEIFQWAYSAAIGRARDLGNRDTSPDAAKNLEVIIQEIEAAKVHFESLVKAREQMGANIASGAQGAIYSASVALDKTIQEIVLQFPAAEPQRLLVSMQAMRLHEKDFIIFRNRIFAEKTLEEHTTLAALVDTLAVSKATKDKLREELTEYRRAFDILANAAVPAALYLNLITTSLQGLTPAVDKIVATATDRQAIAAKALESAQARTRLIIALVGLGAIPYRGALHLADRAQHHGPAQRVGAGDDAACGRRHVRENSGHPGDRRDRRHGAHRHRLQG